MRLHDKVEKAKHALLETIVQVAIVERMLRDVTEVGPNGEVRPIHVRRQFATSDSDAASVADQLHHVNELLEAVDARIAMVLV